MIEPFGGSAAHRALHRPGLVAGIGLRAAATSAELLDLLDACLAVASHRRHDLVALATLSARAGHPALLALAEQLAVPVLSLARDDLSSGVPNPSPRVAALIDVPAVAEAAALAFGPLIVEKRRSANGTCALSAYLPGRSSASIAASTLATSSAGP